MATVELQLARALKNFVDQMEEIVAKAREAITALGPFCDDCGESDPLSGFYPMEIIGPDSISGLLCNACEEARRDRAYQLSQEGGTGG